MTEDGQTSWPWMPRPVAFLVGLLFLSAAAGILMVVDALDPTGRVVGVPETALLAEPIRSVERLMADPVIANVDGKIVVLENALVQDVIGDAVFLVGDRPEDAIAVVMLGELMDRQPEQRVEVSTGDRVAVHGIALRTEALGPPSSFQYLSPDELTRMRQPGLYISALRVIVAR